MDLAQLTAMQIAAVTFFVLIAAALIASAVLSLRKSDMSPLQCILWAIAYLLCKFLWRTRWLNRPELPRGQGAIIVCNHRSSVDPFFVQASTGRKIHWMVAREYCQHSAFGGFLRSCEVIPVGRGGIDTAATKMAIRLAQAGGVVGMLPEGRINMSEEFMLPVRPGAALVAIKAGVPVVPCYIHGAPYRRTVASPFFMPAHVEVRFGQPLDPKNFSDDGEDRQAEQFTRAIIRAIATLADKPYFEPQLAGRKWKPTAEELAEAMAAKDAREGFA
jgi:1-acyl-sn-glycerol-3-phosphate acyltransferase